MKKMFVVVLLVTIAIIPFGLHLLHAQDDTSYKDNTESGFCYVVNQKRNGFCRLAKINCEMVMEQSDKEIIEKVLKCPVRDNPQKPFSAQENIYDKKIGLIPCCAYKIEREQKPLSSD